MTTAIAEQDLQLPWDYFLVKDSDEKMNRPHIEAFRQNEWPAICRYLLQDFHLDVPVEQEPHWVASGKAMYWQLQTTRRIANVKDDNGNDVIGNGGQPVREFVEETTGWTPCGPLPANNPSIVAHYLNKGFRFRPPSSGDLAVEGGAVEALQEAAASQEVSKVERDEKIKKQRTYICLRHSTGKMAFRSWRAYIKHTSYHKEQPTEEPPPSIVARMAKFRFYCFVHDQGFRGERLAKRHIVDELRKGGAATHPTLQDLMVKANK